jgi:hypothetical protein
MCSMAAESRLGIEPLDARLLDGFQCVFRMSKSDVPGNCSRFPRVSDAAHPSGCRPTKSLFRSDQPVLLWFHSSACIFPCINRTRRSSQRPSFSVGIHTKCHAGACTECCEEKFVRIWTGIAATCLDRLVRLDSVLSDRDVLQISSSSRHDRHISRHFEISSLKRCRQNIDTRDFKPTFVRPVKPASLLHRIGHLRHSVRGVIEELDMNVFEQNYWAEARTLLSQLSPPRSAQV